MVGPLANIFGTAPANEEPKITAPLKMRATDVLSLDEIYEPAMTNKEVFKSDRYFSGDKAVEEVQRRIGKKLDPRFQDIVREEGFVAGKYYDDRAKDPVETAGVGQTGKYINMPLEDVFYEKEKEVVSMIPAYNVLDEDIKSALLSARYRGDMKPKHKWVKYFNNGEYEKAATEFLDHREYKQRKKKSKNDGVVKRLDHIANKIRSMK